MKRLSGVFLIFLFTYSFVYPQGSPFLYRIDPPEYIPQNSQFEISVIARVDDKNVDSLKLSVFTDFDLNLLSATQRFKNSQKMIPVLEKDPIGFSGSAYEILFCLNDTTLIFEKSFQIVLMFDAVDKDKTELTFDLQPVDSLLSERLMELFPFSSNEPKNIEINFYDPGRSSAGRFHPAGSCLELAPGSRFSSILKYSEVQNLLIDFWLKSDAKDQSFMNCSIFSAQDTLINMQINEFNMISADNISPSDFFREKFISANSWVFVAIYLDAFENELNVFADDKLLFKKALPAFWQQEDLQIDFYNDDSSSGITSLDLLKIWDYNNDLSLLFENKHYQYFTADSSKLLVFFSFDDQNIETEENEYLSVESELCKFSKSDAPIFSPAPALNVVMYGSFYDLEWSIRDKQKIENFVVEKSTDGNVFTDLTTIEVTDGEKENYSFTDVRDLENPIVYYRIRQINLDQSEIYSSVVKIGHGNIELFRVDQNFPNPFNPVTKITVEVLEQSEFQISVYNVVGKRVAKLYQGTLSKGIYSYDFDATGLPSGIYFYEVKSPVTSIVQKMILTK